jgi:hypothetical protein
LPSGRGSPTRSAFKRDTSPRPVSLSFLLLGAVLTGIRRTAVDADPLWRTRLFGAFVVAFNLGLFRLKPYAYATLVPFLLACCVTTQRKLNGVLLLAALLAVPFAQAAPLPRIARTLHVPAAYSTHVPAVGKLVLEYAQLCGLLIVFGAILIVLYFEARRHADEPAQRSL